MKISLVSIDSGLVRVANDGRITAEDFPADAHNPFEAILGANWAANRVLLDLGRTPYMDSSAIGWLVNSNRQFKASGGRLVVHSVSPMIQRLFDLLKIGKVIPLVGDEVAGRTVLQGE